MRPGAEGLSETEETLETAVTLGRLAEDSMATAQGTKPILFGIDCVVEAGAATVLGPSAPAAAAVGTATPCRG